ncbi:MAG: tol-pal system protein YbgF [Proteobacteria bacterium ST_bin12]|nr:MAG: tol-pal system protein YbgF [Proteobacteria bacterium ST_bin12]
MSNLKKNLPRNLLALLIATTAINSHAALFDDKEARKKILEVEAKSQSNFDANQTAINDLKKSQAAIEKRLTAIEAVIQGQGLADMQNQLESLKQEVAHLKGELELANHHLETTQQRQKDLYTDTDTRLRKIESAAVAPPVAPVAAVVVEEKDVKAFAEADSLSKSAKHKEAFTAFDAFLKDYPNSKLAPDALYGMGYTQFVLKNYKSSIATQQKVIDLHAESPKVPDAMYSMANSQIQLGQVTNAKKTLRDLVVKYPDAEVTPNAQKRLKMLEALK